MSDIDTRAYAAGKAAGRSEARAEFEATWAENLPLIEQRAAKDERMAIERRVRESGVARWLPSHAWDLLISAVRGGDK